MVSILVEALEAPEVSVPGALLGAPAFTSFRTGHRRRPPRNLEKV
jgi:hypothetical protein